MPKRKVVYQYKKERIQNAFDKVIILLLFILLVLLIPGQNIYTLGQYDSAQILRPLPFVIPTPNPYPVKVQGFIAPGAEITAGGIVILDKDSGVYLYKRNENDHMAPASTTKILTALVALDAYSLDDIVTVRNIIKEGQVMGLVSGERISVENLLFGTLIHSGNDAAYALADHYTGGVEKFIKKMNEKAQDLHLENSFFTNPVGFDDPLHKMTPIDLARLADSALSNTTLAKMVAIPQITVSDVTHTYFHSLKNVNELLGKIPGVGGIKTGWTEEAGENLVTLIERNGHRIILVVLKSADRFSDTQKLINWVFDSFRWEYLGPLE